MFNEMRPELSPLPGGQALEQLSRTGDQVNEVVAIDGCRDTVGLGAEAVHRS